MITIRTCSRLDDAEVMQSVLGGSGIEAFIADEDSAVSTFGSAFGGVRLQVKEEDAARAEEILREAYPKE